MATRGSARKKLKRKVRAAAKDSVDSRRGRKLSRKSKKTPTIG